MQFPSAPTLIGWATVVVTALSPFGPAFFDAIHDDNDSFLFEYEYQKNPVVEWNRQINAALKRLEGVAKDASDVPRSVIHRMTRELAINTPALAAWIDLKPLDSIIVTVTNVSNKDLKDIRVQFIGCVGYDSHVTYPDSVASQESPDQLRKVGDSVTISYRKVARRSPDDTTSFARVAFYGHDASKCKPTVTADFDSGKSAVGRQATASEYLQQRRDSKLLWQRWSDNVFKLGLVSICIVIFVQLRSLRRRIARAGASQETPSK